jgi:hypothetical protein
MVWAPLPFPLAWPLAESFVISPDLVLERSTMAKEVGNRELCLTLRVGQTSRVAAAWLAGVQRGNKDFLAPRRIWYSKAREDGSVVFRDALACKLRLRGLISLALCGHGL